MTEPPFTSFINLAADRLGAETVLCSDDFFAKKEKKVEYKFVDIEKNTYGRFFFLKHAKGVVSL